MYEKNPCTGLEHGPHDLVNEARQKLEDLYVSDLDINTLPGTDMSVIGVRYFRFLFNNNDKGMITTETMLEDLYVGATAYGYPEMASSARQFLIGNDPEDTKRSQAVDNYLLILVNAALNEERRAGVVSVERIERLQAAAKELGVSRIDLMLGSLAARFALLIRSKRSVQRS